MLTSSLLHFLIAYTSAMLLAVLLRKREFKDHPEKAKRYDALPLAYKLACWLMVLPLLAATVAHEGFGILGLVFFFLLEAACVRWYRKAGLY